MNIPHLIKHKLRLCRIQVTPNDDNLSYIPSTKKVTITGIKENIGFTYKDPDGTEHLIPFENIHGKFNINHASEYIGREIIASFTYKVINGKMTCVGKSATFDDKTRGNDR